MKKDLYKEVIQSTVTLSLPDSEDGIMIKQIITDSGGNRRTFYVLQNLKGDKIRMSPVELSGLKDVIARLLNKEVAQPTPTPTAKTEFEA
mgnify:CR=1 FL=1